MNKVYLNHRKEVLTLYKTCLLLTKEIGYIPGDRRKNTYVTHNYLMMNIDKRRKIINNLNQKDLGAYVAWNIRILFKKNKYIKNLETINKNKDYAYHFLRNGYSFLFPYCKEYLQDLWCYE